MDLGCIPGGRRSLYLKSRNPPTCSVGRDERDGAGEGAEVTEPQAPEGLRMLQGVEAGDGELLLACVGHGLAAEQITVRIPGPSPSAKRAGTELRPKYLLKKLHTLQWFHYREGEDLCPQVSKLKLDPLQEEKCAGVGQKGQRVEPDFQTAGQATWAASGARQSRDCLTTNSKCFPYSPSLAQPPLLTSLSIPTRDEPRLSMFSVNAQPRAEAV